MELVFCTGSEHKLREVQQLIGSQIKFLTLKDIGYTSEIPEPFETLEENSLAKAVQVNSDTSRDCFAEDTGLFIEALNGEPGVFSARYAGEPSDSEKNIDKVLEKLAHSENRKAYFKTVITLIIHEVVHQFDGVCSGHIDTKRTGGDGFGYDPIFIPDGLASSFAAISSDEKNAISHRKKAFDKFAAYLTSQSAM